MTEPYPLGADSDTDAIRDDPPRHHHQDRLMTSLVQHTEYLRRDPLGELKLLGPGVRAVVTAEHRAYILARETGMPATIVCHVHDSVTYPATRHRWGTVGNEFIRTTWTKATP